MSGEDEDLSKKDHFMVSHFFLFCHLFFMGLAVFKFTFPTFVGFPTFS